MFKVGDFVKIIKEQDNPFCPKILGEIGYIEDIIGEFAQFLCIKDDFIGGGGKVQLNSLQLLEGQELQRAKIAKDKHDLYISKLLDDSNKFRSFCDSLKDKYKDKVLKEFSISSTDIDRIFDIFAEYQDAYDVAYQKYQDGWTKFD